MINVGIVGFGNLGKAIARELKNCPEFNLVEIFSKRDLKETEKLSCLKNYKDKIDLLFLCCGSKDRLEDLSQDCIKDFSIIESYDNHQRLKKHIEYINTLAKENKKIALCSFGWDPGLFSYMRGLFDSVGFAPYTFWGKGLSQGHTQAIKNIPGVKDGLQFTIPNAKILRRLKIAKPLPQNLTFHRRKCYVVCDKKDRDFVKSKITTMPHYFAGQKTTVKFVSQQKLDRLKNFSHKGIVLTKGENFSFSLKTKSNPNLTAKILIAFAKNYQHLIADKSYGAYTIFDLPLTNILPKDKFNYL